ncbi:MAG: hypothetical protein HY741_07400, partial [Chloroflexi bacterium]|nr:hypothetical protein [Chloroflexota bacterium]
MAKVLIFLTANSNLEAVTTPPTPHNALGSGGLGYPGSTDDATIAAGHMITLNAGAGVNNLTLAGGSNVGLLMLNGNTLSINGTLNASPAPGANTILGGGLVRFVGGSRALFGVGWDATTPSWNLEIALTPGATGTSAVPVKAGTIVIASGTFETSSDVRPDNNAANSGTLTIASDATLRVGGNIARTTTVTDQCLSVTVNGVLEQSGSNLSALNININSGGVYRRTGSSGTTVTGALNYAAGSTLEYAGGASQTTGTELAATVHHLTISNASGVTLG